MNKAKDRNNAKKNRRLQFNLIIFERFKPLRFCLLLLFATLIFSSTSLSQDVSFKQEMPKDAEPPPLKVISKEEREQLGKQTDIKNRTKLSLELMNLRLQNAESFNSKKEFREMFKELGKFHALIDNALWFLSTKDTGNNGKVLNNFKRLEIGLRIFLPRLELIRRELPINYEYYVRNLIISVRDARSKAVDPLFDNTVLPDNTTGN